MEALDVATLDESNWRRLVWRSMQEIEAQAKATNGRVSNLERFRWMSVGAVAVIVAIVVPLFVDMVGT